jgi:uncharacterized protein DUF3455
LEADSVRKHAKKTSVRLAVAAIAVLAGAALSLVSHQASATETPADSTEQVIRPPGFELPPGAPTPGPGFRILSAYFVQRGVQTYTCDGTGTFPAASVPAAVLVQYDGRSVIKHYAGPRWTHADGSTLLGAVAERVEQRGTIPWLLLTVTHEGPQGVLSTVSHISRVNTTGGLPPTGPCTPGETRDVPYTADYVFWVPFKAVTH